jgi:hypothetical protein
MEHHRCFRVYITKTRSTRISDTVHFKHQYITKPTLSPESHVIAAAQQLATALKGNIPAGNETAEALKKVSDLFTKIASAKNEAAKAKAQRIRVQATHLPRVENPTQNVPDLPRVENPTQNVPDSQPDVDCCVIPRVKESGMVESTKTPATPQTPTTR